MRHPTVVSVASLVLVLPLVACSRDGGSSGSPSPSASSSSAPAPSTAATAAANGSAASEGLDWKSPVLSPDDTSFKDDRHGFGWGDRCFNEIKAGKLGWAKAACDKGLGLTDVDPGARPPLLYNIGVIARKAGDNDAAKGYFVKSLNLRPAGEAGRPIVEKDLRDLGGTVPPVSPTAIIGKPECKAKNGTETIELFLDWNQNMAYGHLRVTTPAGVSTKAVDAEMYKGLFLIDAAGTPGPLKGKLATVQTDPKKMIQVGDSKQPTVPCE